MDTIAKIDRLADHIHVTMEAYATHIERLRLENPDAVPIQEAIREKSVLETDLPGAMEVIGKIRATWALTPEISRSLDRLEREIVAAAALLSTGAAVQ